MSFMHPLPGLRRLSRSRPVRALRPRAGAACMLGALALTTAGCSVKGADNANVIVGKQAFVAKCGSCHIPNGSGMMRRLS